jgi:CheY-like chemotaxis protein
VTQVDEGPILVVEDNQVNAMILRAMLRKRGYEPYMAIDGVEGVAMTEEHRPRLILMDLQMPRLDGFGAAAEIRRRFRDGPPVIVAVTANAGTEVREACLAAGFACVLAKPVAFDELIATVQRHLGA